MKKQLFKCLFKNKPVSNITSLFLFLVTLVMIISNCIRDQTLAPAEDTTGNSQMIVYPNRGNKLTIVNYKTLEVDRQIIIDIPDTLQIQRMCLSTSKNYLIFCASPEIPPFSNYIISYDIEKDSVCNIFTTGLDSVGAPRLTASYIPDQSSLVYLYSHNVGLYSIDFLTKEVNIISSEYGQSLGKHFYFSLDKKLIAILKKYGSEPAYSEVEFYKTLSVLENSNFVLNQNNRNGIQIDDLTFSENNKKIFISIRLSQMRYVANYFGSYNLESKEYYKSSLTLPWSLNPYYLAYSPKRKEVYTVGHQDKFYILDVSSEDYSLKTIIDLTGKVQGPSRILIRPDENIAFVSCSSTNLVFVIDLANRRVQETIQIERPYLMILL